MFSFITYRKKVSHYLSAIVNFSNCHLFKALLKLVDFHLSLAKT